jgi:hypothetical protein
MNPRLKQITGQVLDEVVPETWTALKYDKIKEIQLRTAELIIKECAEIADKAEPYKASDLIKKHFGFEET